MWPFDYMTTATITNRKESIIGIGISEEASPDILAAVLSWIKGISRPRLCHSVESMIESGMRIWYLESLDFTENDLAHLIEDLKYISDSGFIDFDKDHMPTLVKLQRSTKYEVAADRDEKEQS